MKKKAYWMTSALAAIILMTGCGKEEETEHYGSKKKIEVEDREVLKQAYENDEKGREISFSTPAAWSSQIREIGNVKASSPDWVSITPDKGDKAGNYKITLNLSPNLTEAGRYAHIDILSGNDKITISVSQAGRKEEGEKDPSLSFILLNGKTYGAKPDQRGPIGGGNGYTQIVTGGNYTVKNVGDLKDALSKVKSGEIIFIPSDVSIDLSHEVADNKLVLNIPEGVTIAGDRGYNGNKGALIKCDILFSGNLFRVTGKNVRVTGLRIQGPDPNRNIEHHQEAFGPGGKGRDFYYTYPTSRGFQIENDKFTMDNCEISAFSHTAIYLVKGENHSIHHNYMHHCQHMGLGYCVTLAKSNASIEYNLFDYNRHSIAGTGVSGCSYSAKNNIELGVSLSHCFDMHGGRDRGDGTNIAGTKIEIINNTFRASEKAIGIRGEAEEKCDIYQNWFLEHLTPQAAVMADPLRLTIKDNVYGINNKII